MTKEKKLKTGEDEFNFDEFDGEFGGGGDYMDPSQTGSEDSRSTAGKITRAVGSAALGEIGGIATDANFIKKSLKETLPDSYGTAIDFADTSLDGAARIYDTAAKEAAPAIKDFKKAARKLVPKESAFVPAWAQNLIDRWEDESKDYAQTSVEQQRNDQISSDLSSMFAANLKQQVETSVQDGVEKATERMVDTKRHAQEINLLNKMQLSLDSMDQYNLNVTTNVAKKSLELQYRSLFVLQDILKTQIESSKISAEGLDKIRHNTSLPDYLKFKNGEFRAQIFKQTLAQSLYGSLLGKGKDMFGQLIDNAQGFVGEKVKEAADTARNIIDQALQAKDMFSGIDDEDAKYTMGAAAGIGLFTGENSTIGGKLRGLIKKPLEYAVDKYKESTYYTKHKKEFDKAQGYFLNRDSIIGGALSGKNQMLEDYSESIKDGIEKKKILEKKLVEYKAGKLDESDEDYQSVKEMSKKGGIKNALSNIGDFLKDKGLNFLVDAKDGLTKDIVKDTSSIATIREGGIGLNENFFYTKQTDMTINKVIPNFLSKMLQELTAIRQARTTLEADEASGMPAVDQLYWDPSQNKLSTQEGIVKNIKSQIDNSALEVALSKMFEEYGLSRYYYKAFKDKGKAEEGIRQLKTKLLRYAVDHQSGSITSLLNKNFAEKMGLNNIEIKSLSSIVGTGENESERNLSLGGNKKKQEKRTKFEEAWKDVKPKINDNRKLFEMSEQAGLGDMTMEALNVKSELVKGGGGAKAFKFDADKSVTDMVSGFADQADSAAAIAEKEKKEKTKKQREVEEREARLEQGRAERGVDTTGVDPNKSMGGPIKRMHYSTGGKVVGPGPIGQDSSAARIEPDPSTPAYTVGKDVKLAPGEHVIPVDAVAGVGGGSLKAGHEAFTKLSRTMSVVGKKAKRQIKRELTTGQTGQEGKKLLDKITANAKVEAGYLTKQLSQATDGRSDEYLGKAKENINKIKTKSKAVQAKANGLIEIFRSLDEADRDEMGKFLKLTMKEQEGYFKEGFKSERLKAFFPTYEEYNKYKKDVSGLLKLPEIQAKFNEYADSARAWANAKKADKSSFVGAAINKLEDVTKTVDVTGRTGAVKKAASDIWTSGKKGEAFDKASQQLQDSDIGKAMAGLFEKLSNNFNAVKDKAGEYAGKAGDGINKMFEAGGLAIGKYDEMITLLGTIAQTSAMHYQVAAGMAAGTGLDTSKFSKLNIFKWFKRKPKVGAEKKAEEESQKRSKSTVDKVWGVTSYVPKQIAKGAWWLLKGSTEVAAKSSWAMLKGAVTMPFKAIGYAFSKTEGDIYVSGEKEPRLTKAGVKNGAYVDKKTLKPINSFKDITGEVIDAKTGLTIIAESDFDKIYVRNENGIISKAAKGMFNLTGKALGALVGLFVGSASLAGQITSGLTKLAIGAVKLPFKLPAMLFDRPCDIYVKDKDGVLGKEPRLQAVLMGNGAYFSKSSKLPVTRPSKIDGVIVDKDGNELITADDLKRGIYNVKGELIKGPWTKLFKFALGVAGAIVKPIWGAAKMAGTIAKSIAKGAWAIAAGAGKGIGRLITGKGLFNFSPDEATAIASSQSVSILESIRDILLNSSIVSKKYRQGAWQTKKKKEKEVAKKEDKPKEKKQGVLSKLWDSIKGFAMPLIAAAGAVLMPMVTGAIGLITAPIAAIATGLAKFAPAVLAGLGAIAKMLGADSLMDKIKSRKGAGAKGAAGGAAGASLEKAKSKGYTTVEDRKKDLLEKRAQRQAMNAGPQMPTVTTPNPTMSSAGTVANDSKAYKAGKSAGAMVSSAGSKLKNIAGGPVAMATGVALAGASLFVDENSTTGKVIGGVNDVATYAGAGAMIGSIVPGVGTLVGGLLGGALGVGMKAYDNMDSIADWWNGIDFKAIRYAMYGCPKGDAGYAQSVRALENVCLKHSKMKTEFYLDDSHITQEMIASVFGINPQDERGVAYAVQWYTQRFKPVFSVFAATLANYDPKMSSFSKLESIKDEDKARVTGILSKISSGIYSITNMPPMAGAVTSTCPTYEVVSGLIKEFVSSLSLSKDKAAMLQSKAAKVMGDLPEQKSTDTALAQNATTSTPLKQVVAESASVMNNYGEIENASMADDSVQAAKQGLSKDKLSALDAIRMRQYGLKELSLDKVKALLELEKQGVKIIKYNPDGTARFISNAQTAYYYAKGMFLGGDFESEFGRRWSRWYMQRFLPVYLTYISALKSVGVVDFSKFDGSTLDPKKTAKVMEWLILARTWDVKDSPWDNYELNTDAKSIEPNVLFIRNQYSEKLVTEQMVSDNVKQANVDVAKNYGTDKRNAAASIRAMDNAAMTDPTKTNPALSNPDIESKPASSGTAAPVSTVSAKAPSGISVATGDLLSGSGADQYLALKKGVNFSGLNPEFQKLMRGAIEEYGNKTGKRVGINSGFRTYDQQKAEYDRNPNKAARPGTSSHESGFAVDIDTVVLDEMDKMGLLKKYGLFRPLSGESWHLEPIGVQNVLADAKKNPSLANNAIASGVGRGGSGPGDTMRTSKKVSRYPDMVKQILAAGGQPVENKTNAMSGEPEVKSISNNKVTALGTKNESFGTTNPTNTAAVNSDVESKPKSQAGGSSANANSAGGIKVGDEDVTLKTNGVNPSELNVLGTDKESIKKAIGEAAKINGVDENTAKVVAFLESGFKSDAAASTSSAKGIFQFTNNSWNGYMQAYLKQKGSKAGLKGDEKATDPRANILLGTWALARYAVAKKSTDPTVLYLNHFLGESGADKFIKYLNTAPNTQADTVFQNAAGSNKPIFYKDGGKGAARTIKEVYEYLETEKIQKAAQTLGLSIPKRSASIAPTASSAEPVSTKNETASGGKAQSAMASRAPSKDSLQMASAASNAQSKAPEKSVRSTYESTSIAPTAAAPGINNISKNLEPVSMKATENLLTDQLKVLKNIAEIAEQIKTAMLQRSGGSSQTTSTQAPEQASAAAKPAVAPYEKPSALVNMNKRVF